jgi:hypothetical protein
MLRTIVPAALLLLLGPLGAAEGEKAKTDKPKSGPEKGAAVDAFQVHDVGTGKTLCYI